MMKKNITIKNLQLIDNEALTYTENREFKLSLAVFSAIFLVLFFIFFQPFGVNNYRYEGLISLQWLIEMISFGIPIFITIYISEFFVRPLLIKKTTLFGLIVWFLSEYIFVGTASFLHYNLLGSFHDFHFQSYILHIINISSVIIFPLLGTLFIFRYNILKNEFNDLSIIVKETSEFNQLILFSGAYKKDKIALTPEQILFIESQDNYVALYYLEETEVKKHMLRSTLSSIEKIVNNQLMVRCHRSFIINLCQVETFKKDAHKNCIKLKHYKSDIPVSKKHEAGIAHLIDKFLTIKKENVFVYPYL